MLDEVSSLPIQGVCINWDRIDSRSYLRGIEAIKDLDYLAFNKNITIFVGENGYSLLHNVVVSPGLRGIGLGRKLCQAAIMKSGECGASHIFLQVMQNNPVALNLYKKLGFEKQYTYYYLKI